MVVFETWKGVLTLNLIRNLRDRPNNILKLAIPVCNFLQTYVLVEKKGPWDIFKVL